MLKCSACSDAVYQKGPSALLERSARVISRSKDLLERIDPCVSPVSLGVVTLALRTLSARLTCIPSQTTESLQGTLAHF